MSKKKRKSKAKKRPTPSKRKAREIKVEEDFKAIKTMVVGALCVAAFIAFFVFKIDGLSIYDRLTQDDTAKPAASVPKSN